MATVATEKTVCSKTDQVPLCHYIKHFVEFFLQQIWPSLLNHDSTTSLILALWINYCGWPMEFGSYTHGLQVVSQQFHPLLNLSSLSFC
jgi:hypothetical protein